MFEQHVRWLEELEEYTNRTEAVTCRASYSTDGTTRRHRSPDRRALPDRLKRRSLECRIRTHTRGRTIRVHTDA